MCFKITTLLFSLVFLFTAVNPVPQPGPETILVDQVAAVVDEEIITLTDIEKAILFYPETRQTAGLESRSESQPQEEPESEASFFNNVLDRLIAYKVVFLEYRDQFFLEEEDYEAVQAHVISKFGSIESVMNNLSAYDMTWADFKAFIKEKVLYEKVKRERLQVNIDIDFKEIETFYRERYVPQQEKLNLKPKTVIEMAPLIEEYLRQTRTEEKLAGWLMEIKEAHRIDKKILQETK